MKQDRIYLGITLILAFCTMAPLLDVCSKLAAEAGIPTGMITFARFAVQGALMLPVVLAMGLPMRLGGRVLGLVFLRALLLAASTFTFVSGLRVMPLADTLSISFVSPFVVMLLAHFIYGDEVGPRRIAACIVAFLGALLIIQPSLAVFGLSALWPLGTAFSFALYMIVTRAMSSRLHPVVVQFHTSWAGVVICLPILLIFAEGQIFQLSYVRPEGIQWLWLFGVGFWACLSHMCMTYAFNYAPTATLAPLHYFELIVAVVLGYLIFNDLPNALSVLGMAVIIGSGLYLVHRERLAIRARRRALA